VLRQAGSARCCASSGGPKESDAAAGPLQQRSVKALVLPRFAAGKAIQSARVIMLGELQRY
jgi:hypothetical protein